MARNLHAVLWTGLSGKPEKMGHLVLSAELASFTYTNNYISSGRPGFCLLGDGTIWGTNTVTYPISERIPVFPRLLTLVPGNNPRNLQRRHYLDLLRTRLGKEPPPGMETEWQMLVLGGHGGIEFDPQVIEQTLGPTPSVGGMIPKLLVSIAPTQVEPVFYPSGTRDMSDVVLKIEPPEYNGLLDLEALCLDMHREAGFEVPVYHRYDDDGLHFLAVERFDRVDGKPIPMESLFSVIATGDHQFRETGDILLEELGGIIERFGQVAELGEDIGEQLYRRILMALLTGNGDLHLDNIALLGGLADCRLTPIYDPAPMRAWPRHNLVSSIPFDPSGYTDHGAFFVDLGRSFGLPLAKVLQCIHDAIEATASYPDRVMELDRVPLRQRRQLLEIVKKERLLLENYCQ